MENTRQERVLDIFFRELRGEALSVQWLADEYEMSTKSITQSINDLKVFLAAHRDLVGNTELQYSHQSTCYRLYMDKFLSSKELFSMVEVLIGARAFSKMELLALTDKLKRFTTQEDQGKLSELIRKELYHYPEVKHDCESVQDLLWQLVNCITNKQEITIDYYRVDRKWVTHNLYPASVMFTDYYFYLIAFLTEGNTEKPYYFRGDRIRQVTVHWKKFTTVDTPKFDEGLLRQRRLFMWPGMLQTIRFEFTDPSVQAVLDKLPTAKVIEQDGGKYLFEVEVYGDGIKMWLLSQVTWIKVLAPIELVEEIKEDINALNSIYSK